MNIRHYLGRRPFMFFIDVSGILVFLILGVGGMITMLAPHWLFPAFVPMLTRRNWPVDGERPKMTLYSHTFEQEYRKFYFRMAVKELGEEGILINQNITWYAETARAEHQWQIDTAAASANPYNATFPAATQPAHLFSCRKHDTNDRSCTYYAYDGHWYVLVRFFSNDETRLSLEKMEQLAGLVGERLTAKAE